MHFIFGYCREVPVKIERKTPRMVLLGIAILMVLLFIFLSWEDVDGKIRMGDFSLYAFTGLTQINQTANLKIPSGEGFWRSEPGSSTHILWDSQSQ